MNPSRDQVNRLHVNPRGAGVRIASRPAGSPVNKDDALVELAKIRNSVGALEAFPTSDAKVGVQGPAGLAEPPRFFDHMRAGPRSARL